LCDFAVRVVGEVRVAPECSLLKRDASSVQNLLFSVIFSHLRQAVFCMCFDICVCIHDDWGHFWGHQNTVLGAQMLSEMAVRQAKAKDKDYKLSDSEGL
jgi:hypothetical protein